MIVDIDINIMMEVFIDPRDDLAHMREDIQLEQQSRREAKRTLEDENAELEVEISQWEKGTNKQTKPTHYVVVPTRTQLNNHHLRLLSLSFNVDVD